MENTPQMTGEIREFIEKERTELAFRALAERDEENRDLHKLSQVRVKMSV
jgi:hypothetical protein